MITGKQVASSDICATAFRTTSEPIPAGSPMVTAIRGFCLDKADIYSNANSLSKSKSGEEFYEGLKIKLNLSVVEK
jgi:hypothetical protein